MCFELPDSSAGAFGDRLNRKTPDISVGLRLHHALFCACSTMARSASRGLFAIKIADGLSGRSRRPSMYVFIGASSTAGDPGRTIEQVLEIAGRLGNGCAAAIIFRVCESGLGLGGVGNAAERFALSTVFECGQRRIRQMLRLQSGGNLWFRSNRSPLSNSANAFDMRGRCGLDFIEL